MPKVVLYSHDTFGLGHFRRCLKISECLAASWSGAVQGVLLTGSPWSRRFPMPAGFQVVQLEPVVKRGARDYVSRDERTPFAVVAAERRRVIDQTLRDFAPDLFIVDNVPCGLGGEVLPALRELKSRPGARAVLSLRDVLDSPDAILEEWAASGAYEAIEHLFDEIWVFGDSEDAMALVEAGPLVRAAEKVHACGRLSSAVRGASRARRPAPRNRPVVLVTGGGGRDAAPLVTTYFEALRNHRPTVTSEIVLGPDYPVARGDEPGATDSDDTTVKRFMNNMPDRIAASDVVVAMAGYNTVCEILEAGCPAVLVPRVSPRTEQLIRAQRWQRAGRARVIHPDRLSSDSLWGAIEEVLAMPRQAPLRLRGGEVAAERAMALVGA